ncbi:MAG TPA: sugar transferase [Rhabdochlamydiaceae bacterium]|nr:sugar transferase [Rhabdochlamydiaceae bacterium]
MAIYKKPGKRAFDLFFSVLFIICTSPLYFLIALLVKCTSTGPIFYKGLRMGQHGKLIDCWKFRTMCLNADEKLHHILRTCPELDAEWKTYFKLKNDPRLTPIGKFLRQSSLDELPQIWNVIKGDLSIVGPRPIAIEHKEKAQEEIRSHFGDKTEKILSVKPGLTCIWQIKGRNLLTFQERILLEEEYVDTQSFVLDLRIIIKTVPLLFFSKGAF